MLRGTRPSGLWFRVKNGVMVRVRVMMVTLTVTLFQTLNILCGAAKL